MKRIELAVIFALLLATLGCNQGPSYADLVVIYNAEVAALDRLTEKRDELQAQREILAQPSKGEQAADMLRGILGRAEEMRDRADAELPADAEGLIDQALENANQAEAIASQVLDAVSGSGEEGDAAENQAGLEKIDRRLAKLEEEIAAQQKRVDRAQANRDAAE